MGKHFFSSYPGSLQIAIVALVALVGSSCASATGVPSPTPLSTVTRVAQVSENPILVTTPTLTSIATPQPSTGPANAVSVPRLSISEVPDNLTPYNRDDWKHWVDTDGDCQNTRAEVLIAESSVPVTFTNDGNCTVAEGRWLAPFTGTVVSSARELDIDHMVPLANAHRSGGWAWSPEQKEAYANDLSFPDHLIAVTSTANRSKSDRGPEAWRPPDVNYWCDYALDWITIKVTWSLTATSVEWFALDEMLATCPFQVILDDDFPLPTGQPITATPLPEPDDRPAAGIVIITEIMANPFVVGDEDGEWFEIHNPSHTDTVNINGWTIRDHGTNLHLIGNDSPLLVPPSGYLVLGRNSDTLINGGVSIDYQYSSFALSNSSDEIELVDPQGVIIDVVVYSRSIVFNGSSASLNPAAFTYSENDNQENWCISISTLPGGDKGTPGTSNDSC